MFLSLLNLCDGDATKVLSKKEERTNINIASHVRSIYLRVVEMDRSSEKLYVISIDVAAGPDPKIHFIDLKAAEDFYRLILDGIINETPFMEFDVLKYGAI